MDPEAVAEGKGLVGHDSDWGVIGEAGAHPAVGAGVEEGGVVGVFWVIHEGDAVGGGGCDGAGVIEPLGALPEGVLFAGFLVGVSDEAAAVVNADGFGHAYAEEAEGSFAECDGFFGFELEVDEEPELVIGEEADGGSAGFDEEGFVGGFVEPVAGGGDPGELSLVFDVEDALMDDSGLGLVGPEGEAVDVVMGDPDGVVMGVSGGVVGVSDACEALA